MARKPATKLEEARRSRSGRDADERPAPSGVEELIRRMAALGMSGFFTTESAIRRAFGDTVPQDWVDFATDQSDRTRSEVIDRMAEEVGKQLAETDLAELMSRFISGHTVEVTAKIKLTPNDDEDDRSTGFKARVKLDRD